MEGPTRRGRFSPPKVAEAISLIGGLNHYDRRDKIHPKRLFFLMTSCTPVLFSLSRLSCFDQTAIVFRSILGPKKKYPMSERMARGIKNLPMVIQDLPNEGELFRSDEGESSGAVKQSSGVRQIISREKRIILKKENNVRENIKLSVSDDDCHHLSEFYLGMDCERSESA